MLGLDEYGTGDPLVLVHGLGTNRGVWRDAAPYLSRGRRAIAIDLPGFGDSPPAGRGFDLVEVAWAVADSLDRQIGGDFDLLGHSLGGAIALTLARCRPDRIRRLILSAPAGFRPRSRPLADAVASAAPALLRGRGLLGAPLMRSPAARRLVLWGALHDPARISEERARSMLTASRGATRLREAASAAMTADLARDLSEAEVPVGITFGTRDPLMPPATIELIRRCRPDAPIEAVPDAGHVAQLERPGVFAEATENLLRGLEEPVTVS
jgi:pimeloyl-ACP methyl ester carboxylesterase